MATRCLSPTAPWYALALSTILLRADMQISCLCLGHFFTYTGPSVMFWAVV